MRGRPLCIMSLSFLCVIYLLLTIWPLPIYNNVILDGQTVIIEGQIYQKEFKNNKLLIYLNDACHSDSRNSNLQLNKESYGVIVYLKDSNFKFEELPSIGVTIRIKGSEHSFSEVSNEGQFDIARYYQIRGIDFQVTNAVILGKGGNENDLLEDLCLFRMKMSNIYDSILPENESGIIKAMVLGDKTNINKEVKELYQRAGLSHALCISGMHISLIGLTLYQLFRKMKIPICIAGSIVMFLLVIYGIMTGMGTATYRAVIMFTLSMIAEMIGRAYDLLSAMAFSILLTLIKEPLLIYDSGFLLSFGAVMGIAFVFPTLEEIYRGRNKLFRAMKCSLSIQLFTLPITLFFFFQFPVYSILLNIIMIPLLPILIGSAMIGGIVAIVWIEAGRILCFPCQMILKIYEGGCRLCDKIPGSICVTGRPAIWQIIIYYIILFLFVFYFRKIRNRIVSMLLASLTITILMFLICYTYIPDFTMTVLDVSQGDCIYFRNKSGTTFLFDGGSTDVDEISKYRIVPYLKYQGTSTIDFVFISHTDNDHINGIEGILNEMGNGGIKVKCLIMPVLADRDDAYLRLVELARSKNVQVKYMQKGDRILCTDIELTCLFTGKEISNESKNADSMVLDVKNKKFRALLTGDLEGVGETQIINQMKGKHYNLLKVAHHGSKNSTSKEFLSVIKPEISVISCGLNNSYGHPHQELLKRLQQECKMIYITKDCGAVTIKIYGEKMQLFKAK